LIDYKAQKLRAAMAASKSFSLKNIFHMLLERLQVTLRRKDSCDLCGTFSGLIDRQHGDGNHNVIIGRHEAGN
jgi:hypothetical protein